MDDDLVITAPSLPLFSLRDFTKKVSKEEDWTPDGSVLLRQAFNADVKLVGDPDKRTLDVTISTAKRDRENDTIAIDGWDIRAYKKNPVVLWAHSYSTPPIGKSLNVGPDGNKLKSTAQFMPPEINPFADTIFQMYMGKWMRAFSVGFVPKEWDWNEKERGVDFTKQELLEYSAVPVPANPDALAGAKNAGIDLKPLVAWAEEVLDEWVDHGEVGLWIPRSVIESTWKTSAGDRTIVQMPEGTPRDVLMKVAELTGAEEASLTPHQDPPPDGTPAADVKVPSEAPSSLLLHTKVGDVEETTRHAIRFSDIPEGEGPLLIRISDDGRDIPMEAVEAIRQLISEETGRSTIAVIGDAEVKIETITLVDTGVGFIKGEVGKVKVSDRVLSAEEIAKQAAGEVQEPDLQTDITGCARCQGDHEAMPFFRMEQPIDGYTHWALCEVSQAPVLLKVETDSTPVEPEDEGEAMLKDFLDARVAENGAPPVEDLLEAFKGLPDEEKKELVEDGLREAGLPDEVARAYAAKTGRLPGR